MFNVNAANSDSNKYNIISYNLYKIYLNRYW